MDEIKWKTKIGFGRRLCANGSWFVGALCACAVVALILLPFTNGNVGDMLFVAKLTALMLAGTWIIIFIAVLLRHLTNRGVTVDYRVTDDEIRVAVRSKKIRVRGIPVYALRRVVTTPYGLKVTTGGHKALLFCDKHTAHMVRRLLNGEMS